MLPGLAKRVVDNVLPDVEERMTRAVREVLGTDDPTYCRWSMMIMGQRGDFEWRVERPADFLERPEDWPETRYEAKARRKGHEVWYFRYLRTD